MRALIQTLLPRAKEEIKYGIPTFVLEKNIVHFGGTKNHVALYPGAAAVEHFKNELTYYKTSKGTIKFEPEEPLPKALIAQIVAFCEMQASAKSKAKK